MSIQKTNQQAKNKIKLLQITTAIKTSFKTYDNYRRYRLKNYFKLKLKFTVKKFENFMKINNFYLILCLI